MEVNIKHDQDGKIQEIVLKRNIKTDYFDHIFLNAVKNVIVDDDWSAWEDMVV